MRKVTFIFLLSGLVGFKSWSQSLDLGSFLQGGVEDAKTLTQSYLEPAFVGFGYAMNSGWYNTGKPHKLLGFDITAGVSLATVPDEARTFVFDSNDYNNVFFAGGSVSTPTIFGANLPASELPQLSFRDATDVDMDGDTMEELIRISAPTGVGIEEADFYPLSNPAVPAPYAQIGIGLIKGTEVKLRIVPEYSFGDDGDGSVKMFGLGFMHDVKQWIPGMKLLPFDLSAFFGFNSMTTSMAIDADNGQTAEFKVGGTTLQGIISKKIVLFTFYAGLGIVTTSTDFSMLGDYPVDFQDAPLSDPLNFSYSSGGPRANIGARLKLLILTAHVEYAIQKYNTLTAGVGISIR